MVLVHHRFEHRLATDILIDLYAFVYQQAVALQYNNAIREKPCSIIIYDNVLVV